MAGSSSAPWRRKQEASVTGVMRGGVGGKEERSVEGRKLVP